jgi:hypothetical protein
MIASQVQQQV